MHRSLWCVMALAMAASAAAQTPARGQAAFNPEISLTLQGTAASIQRDPETYQITGFAPTGGEVGPPRRGFSLGESELAIAGNIDPYFRGQLVAALTPDNELEVEEAFFQTLALGRGFTLKGGRFLSGIGYQNEIHQHAWDFQDAPLAYQAFLGGRFNDEGVQLRWVAPTELLVELGAEVGRGRGFPGSDPNKNGAGAWSVFGHVGGDFRTAAWRSGLSFLQASPKGREFEDVDSSGNPATQSFSGTSKLWIADFVVKWTDFKVQGEYFRRRESGDLTSNDMLTDRYESTQSGWYAQAVYRFTPRWRAGYRHDRLDHGTVSTGIVDSPLLTTDYNPSRNTAMLDWSPSEFSRLRLQYAYDRSRANVTDNQLVLQYLFNLGAHGAHRF